MYHSSCIWGARLGESSLVCLPLEKPPADKAAGMWRKLYPLNHFYIHSTDLLGSGPHCSPLLLPAPFPTYWLHPPSSSLYQLLYHNEQRPLLTDRGVPWSGCSSLSLIVESWSADGYSGKVSKDSTERPWILCSRLDLGRVGWCFSWCLLKSLTWFFKKCAPTLGGCECYHVCSEGSKQLPCMGRVESDGGFDDLCDG